MSTLEISGLSKHFGETKAVDDANLSIERGEFVGVIGRSGAGKSTLLRLINRLIDPTLGSISFDGTDITQLKGKELVVIDIHSGLGPYGFGELISDHPLDSAGSRFAEKLFGDAIAATAKGESFSAPKKGLMDYRWHQLMSELGCYITLEFGTYNTDKLFLTLLNEHRYWASHDKIAMNDKGYLEHRKAMLQQFCPDDQLWQQAVLFKVWQVAARVINYYQ